MGYLNPLLDLDAGRELLALPPQDRARIARVMRDLRRQANVEADKAWKRRKGPMAAYWRAVSTYARHMAHALDHDERTAPAARRAVGDFTLQAPAGGVLC